MSNYDDFFLEPSVVTTGVWSPSVEDGSGNPGTIQTQAGKWQRQIDLVYIEFFVEISSKGSMTGSQVKFGNLPFTATEVSSGKSGAAISFSFAENYDEIITSNVVVFTGAVDNTTKIDLRYWTDGPSGIDAVAVSGIDATFSIAGSGHYFAVPI